MKDWLKEKNQYLRLYQSHILKQVMKRKSPEKSNFSSKREQTGVWCYCRKTNDAFLYTTHLHDEFLYTITSLALGIASVDSSLYQRGKACFINYIMKSSNSVSSFYPQTAKWILDWAAVKTYHILKG